MPELDQLRRSGRGTFREGQAAPPTSLPEVRVPPSTIQNVEDPRTGSDRAPGFGGVDVQPNVPVVTPPERMPRELLGSEGGGGGRGADSPPDTGDFQGGFRDFAKTAGLGLAGTLNPAIGLSIAADFLYNDYKGRGGGGVSGADDLDRFGRGELSDADRERQENAASGRDKSYSPDPSDVTPGGGGQQPDPEPLAQGGFVKGPGGPTSDSVPIAASNGEFVISAEAAKVLGPNVLNLLNDPVLARDVAMLIETAMIAGNNNGGDQLMPMSGPPSHRY